ncbi:MAG: glycoside hydrolase family 1 protein [Lewinellaceae bacterium]|nr:glycoside hydrolase family 1 protein [Lewinellaceae bacterium]
MEEACGPATEFWDRYETDFDLARQMGVQIHRMSVEWSRVFPQPHQPDQAALVHYRQQLQALQQRGIKTMLCLHHFTIPHWLEKQGGFRRQRHCLHHFREYLQTVVPALGDLVDYWLPINEPNVVPLASYLVGLFPPFLHNPLPSARYTAPSLLCMRPVTTRLSSTFQHPRLV